MSKLNNHGVIVIPMIVWWAVALGVGLVVARVALDKETIVEQTTRPVVEILGMPLKYIGLSIAITILIMGVCHGIGILNNNRRKHK